MADEHRRHRHRALVAAGVLGVVLGAGSVAAAVAGPPPTELSAPEVTAVARSSALQDLVPPADVERATEEVLSRPEFAPVRLTWWQQLREDARAWLAQRLAELVTGTSGTVLAWGVVVIGMLVAVAIAWRVLRGTDRDPDLVDLEVALERRSAAEWDARSRRAEAEGDLRGAVRAAYAAVLASYVEAGLVEDVPGRTVGEYRREVRVAAPLRSPDFERASDRFEAVWYAHAAPDAAGLGDVRSAQLHPSAVR